MAVQKVDPEGYLAQGPTRETLHGARHLSRHPRELDRVFLGIRQGGGGPYQLPLSHYMLYLTVIFQWSFRKVHITISAEESLEQSIFMC